MKASTLSEPGDIDNDDLQEQLQPVRYQLDVLKQKRKLTLLGDQQGLQNVQCRAEDDIKRAPSYFPTHQCEEVGIFRISHKNNSVPKYSTL